MWRTLFSRETSQGAPNTTWNYYLVFLCGYYPPQTQLHFDSGQSDQYILYKIIIIYYLSSAVSRLSAMQNVEKDKNLWIHDQKGKERHIAFQSVPRANALLSVWCCSMSIVCKFYRIIGSGERGQKVRFLTFGFVCTSRPWCSCLLILFEVDFQRDNTLKNIA